MTACFGTPVPSPFVREVNRMVSEAIERQSAPPVTFHNGDAIQTQVPYDDWPITLVREGGSWRAVGIPADRADNGTRTDAEIAAWLADEVAVLKIEQEHQWEYGPKPPGAVIGDPIECYLCGVKYADLPDDVKAWV